MKVAVIGAGYGGLLAIKHAKAEGFQVTCFERSETIGGLWVYEGKSPAYKNLQTNLPKELMGFKDYPFTGPNESFVSREEVLDFLKRFAHDFILEENILFNHQVKNVKPLLGNKWEIMAENLKTDTTHSGIYDAVFICNGKYWCPNIPEIKGGQYFKGKILHSVHYKRPDVFKGKFQVRIIF